MSLAFQSSECDALDEVSLSEGEQDDDGCQHDGRGRHQIPPLCRVGALEGRDIGEVLAEAGNLLSPGVISRWGYLAEAEDHLMTGIRESIARSAYAGPASTVRIELASMGVDSGRP